MSSVPKSKVRRAAVLLNDDQTRGANSRLAQLTGASLATIKAWQAEPGAAHRKEMSAVARRSVATLLVLKANGLLDERLQKQVDAVEAHMLAGRGRLANILFELTGWRSSADEEDT